MTTTPELIQPGTGVVLSISTSLVLTGNTGLSVAIKSPITKTETVLTGGVINATDPTILDYTIQAGDFSEIGIYTIVPIAAFSGAPELCGEQALLNVVDRFSQ